MNNNDKKPIKMFTQDEPMRVNEFLCTSQNIRLKFMPRFNHLQNALKYSFTPCQSTFGTLSIKIIYIEDFWGPNKNYTNGFSFSYMEGWLSK